MPGFDVVRRLAVRWSVVVITSLLGAAIGLGLSLTQTRTYVSTTQLFLATPAGGGLQGDTFLQGRIKTYVAVLNSEVVARRVIGGLHLSESPSALRQRITVTVPLDTVILTVSVGDSHPQRAQAIAGAVAIEGARFIEALEAPSSKAPSPIRTVILTPASLPLVPSAPRTRLNTALGLVVGFATGAALKLFRDARRLPG